MSFSRSSRSSGKKHYGDEHRGSKYYKREGFFNRILKMFDSISNSDSRYTKHRSHDSHENYNSYENHNRRRRYKSSSWS